MVQKPLVFISSTSDLKAARELVGKVLYSTGHYDYDAQDIAPTDGGELLQVLRDRIAPCKLVIQLVGNRYGAEPPTPTPEFGRKSYTQFEALYAESLGIKVIYHFVDDAFPRDALLPESDDRAALQADYRQHIKGANKLRYTVSNADQLKNSVYEIALDLRGFREAQERQHRELVDKLAALPAELRAAVAPNPPEQSQAEPRPSTPDAIEKEALDTGAQTELGLLARSIRKFINRIEQSTDSQSPVFPVRVKYLSEQDDSEDLSLLLGEHQSILPFFNDNNCQLVIVGERGTGKTFTMFRLIEQLSDLTLSDKHAAVPLLFNLSSWNDTYEGARRRFTEYLSPKRSGVKSNTLDCWLEDQMVSNYSMQRKVARRLLDNNQIIICLDGLDELGESGHQDGGLQSETGKALRDACVRAINGTLSQDRSVQIVVCCREDTYRDLSVKPDIARPLQTVRLSREEIVQSAAAWKTNSGLAAAIAESPELAERARVQLFLGMMYIAYQHMSKHAILEVSKQPAEKWERHLFDHYVDQCIKNAHDSGLLNKRLVESFLSWMATQNDNDLVLDDLQPAVLRLDGSAEGLRLWTSYRRLSILLLSLILAFAESIGPTLIVGSGHLFKEGIAAGLLYSLIMFVSSIALLSVLYAAAFRCSRWLGFGIFLGLAWGFECALMVFLTPPDARAESTNGTLRGALSMFVTSFPLAAAFFMFVGVYMFERLVRHRIRYAAKPGIQWHEIVPIEPRNWQWTSGTSFWRGGWVGILVVPIVLAVGWLGGQSVRAMVYAPTLALIVCLYSGWSGTGTARISVVPNQGIERSLRHGLRMMWLFVGIAVPVTMSIYWVKRGWEHAVSGAFGGLSLAFAFYIFGGMEVIRQACLGSVLHWSGKTPSWYCWPPWKATVAFLDSLVRFKLLRHSAGGYMFRHQSFKEFYRKRAEDRAATAAAATAT